MFRNLQRVVGELQRLPKQGVSTHDKGGHRVIDKPSTPHGDPVGQGVVSKGLTAEHTKGAHTVVSKGSAGKDYDGRGGSQALAESDDPDGATSNPSGGQYRAYPLGDPNSILAQSNQTPTPALSSSLPYTLKFDGLKKQARQILNNLEGIGKELKGFGCQRYNACVSEGTSTAMQLPPGQLQKIVGELRALGLNYAVRLRRRTVSRG